ncbi:hypothetical protein [Streptomyces chattanoogensis]|nr:hypothetical protein [Streptomyces chattanoogensis]
MTPTTVVPPGETCGRDLWENELDRDATKGAARPNDVQSSPVAQGA